MSDLKLLTVKEACAVTRLSKSKLYELLHEGVIRRVKLAACAKVLVSEAELRRYINAGVESGTAQASGV